MSISTIPAASGRRSPFALVTLDASGAFHSCNEDARVLLGADDQALAEVARQLMEHLREQGCEGEDPGAFCRLPALQGEDREVRVQVCRLEDGGVIIGLADVTNLLRDQEALRGRVSQRERELEQALAAKREFLSNMSHELRTPLNGILGMADLLTLTDITDEQRLYVDAVKRSGRDLLQIINHLLDLSAAERGLLQLRSQEFSLRETLEPVFATLSRLARDKGLHWSAMIQENTPDALVGDPDRLKQVVFNIAGNAVKFTRTGHVAVHVHPWTPIAEPSPGAMAPDAPDALHPVLVFQVHDTGPGIPPEKREHMFDPFVVGEDLLTKRHAGAGLGLPVSKTLVEMMGGALSLEERGDSYSGKERGAASGKERGGESHGCTFTFTCRLRASARKTIPREAAASSPRPLDVLLVEDEEISRMFAQVFLSRRGHAVTAVENGREAVEIMARRRFDVVFMDIQMPEMDGLEATRRIRQGGQAGDGFEPVLDPDTPIVALTVFSSPEDCRRSLDAGMDECLGKPLDADRLDRAIGGALAKRGRRV